MGLFYTLDDDNNPIAVEVIEWGMWFEKNIERRRVGLTHIHKYRVSTVFIGVDLDPWRGDDTFPYLYETMVFDDNDEVATRRYHTWDEAVSGHEEMVRKWEEN